MQADDDNGDAGARNEMVAGAAVDGDARRAFLLRNRERDSERLPSHREHGVGQI
jgi:hypothetical protein